MLFPSFLWHLPCGFLGYSTSVAELQDQDLLGNTVFPSFNSSSQRLSKKVFSAVAAGAEKGPCLKKKILLWA